MCSRSTSTPTTTGSGRPSRASGRELVVIEYNAALDAGARLVKPLADVSGWDETDYYGASLGALRSLGETKGYTYVHTDLAGANAFFVRSDLVERVGHR